MRQTEIAGFRPESYEILQAVATETSGLSPWINHFTVVQAGLRRDHTRSIATEMPWPTPMHMVDSACRPPVSAS